MTKQEQWTALQYVADDYAATSNLSSSFDFGFDLDTLQESYWSMRELPTSTQNSCEEAASLVLRPQFLGPGTQ